VTTPLDALAIALREAAGYNAAAEAPPEAVVWCDANGEFLPLLPTLRERLPELFTYGDFDPATRTGPAVWLRAVVARALPEIEWPDWSTPILYLPGVARETLKGAEDCPLLLQPLVWFTVAGNLFGHVNGKDWTLRGFLAAERGPLKLEIVDDAAARAALAHAAVRFCAKPVDELRGKRWDADALHALLAPDLAADMLDWLDGRFDAEADAGRFAAFAGQAKKTLGFDPRKASTYDGAMQLAAKAKRWAQIWERFAAAAGAAYPGVVALLERLEPPDLLADRSCYPKVNRDAEAALRQALADLTELKRSTAEKRVLALAEQHAWRRDTVWAKRGEAPLADALRHLAVIAETTVPAPHDAESLAVLYFESGWRADLAALDALAAAPRAIDRQAVTVALRAIYLPWLEDGASGLQTLVKAGKVPLARPGKPPKGDVLLFVDGLRMDLARRLVTQFEPAFKATIGWCWSGFPTVTATCKPLISPAVGLLRGAEALGDLYPVDAEGKPAQKPVLWRLLQEAGWDTGDAPIGARPLWSEAGDFDSQGHALGAGMVDQLTIGLRNLADRVAALVGAGRRVRIVTDHGWLLLPGGLPHAVLDPGLVEPKGKRSRCAFVKPAATTSYLEVPWSWNPALTVATATGARAFLAGQDYAHGGLSPQECILPVIAVERRVHATTVAITTTAWQGLRLRVDIAGASEQTIDLRAGEGTSGPSLIKGGRVLDERGRTSFLVSDVHEGETATLVVVDEAGAVLAHKVLTIGGE
jgi:hypothetical protein